MPRAAQPLDDPWLAPYCHELEQRDIRVNNALRRLTGEASLSSLVSFACAHLHYGLHRNEAGWIFRERAPNATAVTLFGDFCGWSRERGLRCERNGATGDWEARVPADELRPGSRYRLFIEWPNGGGDRIPSFARRVVQDPRTLIWNAEVPVPDLSYQWRHSAPPPASPTLIYEAHVGMAQEKPCVGSFDEFTRNVLPVIARNGYTTVQLMGILEHPYYGSFGYHVSSFFAVSSRFGTPDDFKRLVDTAHGLGLRVIVDLVHSHAVKNEVEGLSLFDGTDHLYFHTGPRGQHVAWDSRCFDYGKPETLHFLLSNCRFWIEEYRLDGFRFDGVTSMLYRDHGLGAAFTTYERYFSDNVDLDAMTYLALAARLIHAVNPGAVVIAEDVSGMPGLAATTGRGAVGFDYRLAMGVPDMWFKLLKDCPDESWNMHWIWTELTNRRREERTISYVESHDQALVGGKTLIFEMLDAAMYDRMHRDSESLAVDRGMALHKIARLATLMSAFGGYLTFMGNEFGHPEWIDFPRAGNGWSYHHARRLWHLRYAPGLRFAFLDAFETAMLFLARDALSNDDRGAQRLLIDEDRKLLAFLRNRFVAVFNFHPIRSFEAVAIEVPPGRYRLSLDTDEPRFGGHGRLAAGQTWNSERTVRGGEARDSVRLYLPSRCALVLERICGS